MGQLSFARGERDGQPTGRIDRATEDFGDRFGALLARIPGLQDGADAVQPWHEDRPTGFKHNHGPGIGAGNRLDETILPLGQMEIGDVDGFAHPLVREKRHRVGPSGDFRRARNVAPIVEFDPSARKMPPDCVEGRPRIEDLGLVSADVIFRRHAAPRDDLR